MQKDKMIESLRLELAEVQIKLVEMENMGGGRMQELERTLLETRMTNARLMEDNESYQLLLSEKTLNGDFSHNDILRSNSAMEVERRTGSRSGPSNSLAEELSSAVESDQDADSERIRRLESEVSALKDQKQALTLYINKIIERILQHQGGFENILSMQDEDTPNVGGPVQKMLPPRLNKDKDLPPPPPPPSESAAVGKENVAPPTGASSFLQRAKSVAYGANKPRPRPQSTYIPTSNAQPGVTEDIATAPSIPLSRSKSNRMSMNLDRRYTTEWASSAAAVVGNMYRGPSGEHAPASPGVMSPRNSTSVFFRTPSGNNAPTVSSIQEAVGDSSDGEDANAAEQARKSALDALNGSSAEAVSIDTPSPPRSTASREDRTGALGPAPVMTGNKMRPLRLVQEAAEEDKAKAGNRSSWLPQNVSTWFGKGDQSQGNP